MTGYEDDDELDEHVLRPFIVTRGRTKASEGIAMESLVDRLKLDGDRGEVLTNPHHIQIWDELESMLSIAELSALLRLPLGVVLVLVSDMAELGVVEVYKTAATDDLELVRKLIDGVRAL